MAGLILPGQGFKPIGVPRAPFKFSEQREHAEEILRLVGDLDDLELFYGQVLVAKYIRSAVGTMGLLASADTQREDTFLGKIGLVLMVGPLAFKDEAGREFGGARVKRGEFATYHSSDGVDSDLVAIDGLTVVHCRILQDAQIRGRVKYPDRIW